jgi:cytochrome b561
MLYVLMLAGRRYSGWSVQLGGRISVAVVQRYVNSPPAVMSPSSGLKGAIKEWHQTGAVISPCVIGAHVLGSLKQSHHSSLIGR